MITIEQEAVVTPDHQLTLHVPVSVAPGRRRVVVVLEDDRAATADETKHGLEDFPQFPEAVLQQPHLSRDAIYDERGR
jgi:hypothetical protein